MLHSGVPDLGVTKNMDEKKDGNFPAGKSLVTRNPEENELRAPTQIILL